MVNIEIHKDNSGKVKMFTVSGHSDYGESGNDVVCSAVSVLTQTAVLGLKVTASIKVEYKIEDGYLECIIFDTIDEMKSLKANAILDTMVLGLKNIAKNYSQFIKIRIK